MVVGVVVGVGGDSKENPPPRCDCVRGWVAVGQVVLGKHVGSLLASGYAVAKTRSMCRAAWAAQCPGVLCPDADRGRAERSGLARPTGWAPLRAACRRGCGLRRRGALTGGVHSLQQHPVAGHSLVEGHAVPRLVRPHRRHLRGRCRGHSRAGAQAVGMQRSCMHAARMQWASCLRCLLGPDNHGCSHAPLRGLRGACKRAAGSAPGRPQSPLRRRACRPHPECEPARGRQQVCAQVCDEGERGFRALQAAVDQRHVLKGLGHKRWWHCRQPLDEHTWMLSQSQTSAARKSAHPQPALALSPGLTVPLMTRPKASNLEQSALGKSLQM